MISWDEHRHQLGASTLNSSLPIYQHQSAYPRDAAELRESIAVIIYVDQRKASEHPVHTLVICMQDVVQSSVPACRIF